MIIISICFIVVCIIVLALIEVNDKWNNITKPPKGWMNNKGFRTKF